MRVGGCSGTGDIVELGTAVGHLKAVEMKGWRWSWFLGNCDSLDKMFHKWCWMSKCLKYDFSKYGARETSLVGRGRVFLSILSSVFSYGRQAGWVCRGNVQTKELFFKGSLGQVASKYPLKYSKQRERGVCWFCREILKGRGGCGLWNLGESRWYST